MIDGIIFLAGYIPFPVLVSHDNTKHLLENSFGPCFQECDKIGSMFPNFNFNVSHHGDYVAISSEPLCLVGLDIVSPIIPQGETVPEFIQNFSSSFSSLEWNNIVTAGADAEVLLEFYRYGYIHLREILSRNLQKGALQTIYRIACLFSIIYFFLLHSGNNVNKLSSYIILYNKVAQMFH